MDSHATTTRVGELAQVKRRFDQWRRNQGRRARIPDELWELAVKAATANGIHATACRLRLNPTSLKKHMPRLVESPASNDAPRFVELPWLGTSPVPECILEAEDQAGRKLRIHLKGEATAHAASLGRMLWRVEE